LLVLFSLSVATRCVDASEGWPDPPAADDYTPGALAAYQQALTARWGHYRDIPLDVKAEYFTWELWRYHVTSFDQLYHRALLSAQVGERPQVYPDRDASTWDGAYLAALAYEYAVKHDGDALVRLGRALRGMHFFFQVTGTPGLPARCVNRADGIVDPPMKPNRYTAPDGTVYCYEADPAKGGFNQIAGGYAAVMMLAYPDLDDELKRLVRSDVADLVLQIIDHDYRATDRHGRRTTYGDLTPLVGTIGVPFNAQVAYEIVALGYSFPPDDPAKRERINEQFRRLRGEHHVYYENPISPVQPQRVAISPLAKGMNDRNHAMQAAYTGLALEMDFARRTRSQFNEKFVYQLGQTMALGIRHPDMQRHALCQFFWAGITREPAVLECIERRRANEARAEIAAGLAAGVEQLRRFRLERFIRPGRVVETADAHWVDEWRPDDCYWKEGPRGVFIASGPALSQCFCAADYLLAYWVMRYYALDRDPALARQALPVLQPTSGVERLR